MDNNKRNTKNDKSIHKPEVKTNSRMVNTNISLFDIDLTPNEIGAKLAVENLRRAVREVTQEI